MSETTKVTVLDDPPIVEIPVPELKVPDSPPVPKISVKEAKQLEAILSKIAPAHVNTPALKVLIYGDPGVGKTTFAASAPKPLLIDVERGSRAVITAGTPVDVLEFKSIEQVEATINFLKNGNSAFDKYDTIILDSITEMQARLIDQQLRAASLGGAPAYKPDWEIWGENTQRLRMLIGAFRDIEKNLICIAHTKTEKDDRTGIVTTKPLLTPGLAKTVVGAFDIVGYLRIDSKGERVLRLHPNKTIQAKSRLQLPEEVTKPKWTDLNK